MAINPKEKESEVVTFPVEVDEKVRALFSMQQVSMVSKEIFDDQKKEFEEYLRFNKDGINIKTSQAMHTLYGLITYKKRDADKVDTDALIELVKSGVITLESLVAMGSFSASKVRDSLPKSASDKVIKAGEPVQYLEFKANTEFKSECAEVISPMLEGFNIGGKPVASSKPPVEEKKTKKVSKAKPVLKVKKGNEDELKRIIGE